MKKDGLRPFLGLTYTFPVTRTRDKIAFGIGLTLFILLMLFFLSPLIVTLFSSFLGY